MSLHQCEIDRLNATISNCESMNTSLKNDLKNARNRMNQAKKNKKDFSAIETEIENIQHQQTENKNAKKAAEISLKDLKKQIEEEIKPVIKKKFDYNIPVAKIDDAGITTTGTFSEGNQLPLLVKEYREYRLNNNLWHESKTSIHYVVNSGKQYCRMVDDKEVALSGQ